MRKIGILIACGSLLALGCDDGRGGTDAGTIMLMDAGPRDSGPPRLDSGTGMCSIAGLPGIPPLPAGCVPRCSAATRSAAAACGADSACLNGALDGDTTPAVTIDFGMGMTDSLDCTNCYYWQIQSCIFDSCPTQLEACLECADNCDPDVAGCEAEGTAIDTCIMTNMVALQGCANPRVNACFATTGGFLPDFRALPDLVTPERLNMIRGRIPASVHR